MSLVPSPLLFNTPLEILEAIVAQSDAATLASWARVGKPLVPAARRSLYHTVVLTRQEDIESFLEQLCLARVSSPSSESADCSLLACHKTIKYLDLGCLPSPEFLVFLSDTFGSSSTPADLELTLTTAGQTRPELVHFWAPRLLLAIQPIVYYGPLALIAHRTDFPTLPPLHLALVLSIVPTLGPLSRHPSQVPDCFGERGHVFGMTQLCAMDGSSLRWADNVLRQLNRGLLLVEGLSFEVDEFRAWVETQKPYFASHPKTRVKGWASFEEMEAWHDDFKAQRIAYINEIHARGRRPVDPWSVVWDLDSGKSSVAKLRANSSSPF